MIEPRDGSVVSQESVKVICIVDKPEAVTHLKINRVDATLKRDLGTATVKLDHGANRIVSVDRKHDGTYSTYLLGKIERTRSF